MSDYSDYDTHRVIALDVGVDSKADTVDPALSVLQMALDLDTEMTALEYFESDERPACGASLLINTFNGTVMYLNENTGTTWDGNVSDIVAMFEAEHG